MKKQKIEIQSVRKAFKDNQVLKEINMVCESGKIYGIVGYNGCGKTVLFKCVCGFYKVDQGEIFVNDKRMGKDIDMLTNAGILIEEPGYIRNLNGYKNLAFLYGIRNKKNKAKLQNIMKTVGLDPSSRKKVEKYSLGMRQRLAIAQATMEDQDILILDEPMNGLDKEGVQAMRCFFNELKEQGKLIILASHNREDINILCDEIYEMDQGCLTKIEKIE